MKETLATTTAKCEADLATQTKLTELYKRLSEEERAKGNDLSQVCVVACSCAARG
jgi:hypothetical protein